MSVRSYAPTAELVSSSVGIVFFNHMGSCVLSDTGRDAQHLANTTRMIVIAADRPGSGFTYPGQDRKLAGDYIGAISRLAGRRIMPEVEAAGLDSLVIAGRSAGGLAGLTTVCTEQLPVIAVNAQEVVGWSRVTVAQGRQIFNAYQVQQKALFADAGCELIKPEPTDQTGWRWLVRAATILTTAPIDQANNKGVWSQDLALTSAFTIASRHPQVRADLIFAEQSLVVSSDEVEDLQRQLPATRAQHGESAPFTVRIEPRTLHDSFNLRVFSARLIGETAMAVLPPQN